MWGSAQRQRAKRREIHAQRHKPCAGRHSGLDPESSGKLDSCLRRNDEHGCSYQRADTNWFSVLLVTNCDQAPLRGQQS